MQTSHDKCEGMKEKYCLGACEQEEDAAEYNYRVAEAIESLDAKPSFAIIEEGLNAGERSCVLVLKGKLYGMGYLPFDLQVTEPGSLQELLPPYKANNYINNLVSGYAAKFPQKVIMFENDFVQSSH
jgi:DNA polymerase-3 subunit epsilon